jgi:peptidyl-dipeptidase Dcp
VFCLQNTDLWPFSGWPYALIKESNMSANSLLSPWTTPFEIPPFEQIKDDEFSSAFAEAMAAHWSEIETIRSSTEPANFDNTIVALERSGRALARVKSVFFNLVGSNSNPALQAIEREIVPKLATHDSQIRLDGQLFARIESIYQQRSSLQLDEESLRLVERYFLDFRFAGAHLAPDERTRMAEISQSLARLYTAFSQNVLADEAEYAKLLTQESELAGLPDFVRSAARAAAEARGFKDPAAHVITLSRSLLTPFMTFSESRELRRELWQAWCLRGERLAAHDNRPLIQEILQLRHERAQLLGYNSSAHRALADTMAGTPEAVRELLMTVWVPAKTRAEAEYNEMLALAKRDPKQPLASLEAWDWHFWAEKLRAERYALEESVVKPYFQLHKMTEAMFYVAGQLFGLVFKPLDQFPRYRPELSGWEVQSKDGEHVGVFISDNFARQNKRSGAWMSTFRNQAGLLEPSRPIVVNNNNFSAPAPGQPALLSLDDARTLFHEFGHGLHGLLSNCRYPRLAGTQVLRDFVEFPSQIMENWLLQPEVLRRFALHVKTGEPMPESLIDRIQKARGFNQGFATVEYVSSALVDLALHEQTDFSKLDPIAFEKTVLDQLGMPKAIGMRHRLPHFLHLFSSDAYASAYYVYMWAEVLDADGFEAFLESGDIFQPDLAKRLKDFVYSRGNSIAPMRAFEAFRGRLPQVAALLRQRGLVSA